MIYTNLFIDIYEFVPFYYVDLTDEFLFGSDFGIVYEN